VPGLGELGLADYAVKSRLSSMAVVLHSRTGGFCRIVSEINLELRNQYVLGYPLPCGARWEVAQGAYIMIDLSRISEILDYAPYREERDAAA
jgi:hypothetical protein